MATTGQILHDCFLSLDDVEFAGATSVALAITSETVTINPMGTEWNTAYRGMMDFSLKVEVSGGSPAQAKTVFDLFKAGLPIGFELRATSAPRSTTNPAWVGQVTVQDITPLSGGTGEANALSFTLVSAGELDLVETVTP